MFGRTKCEPFRFLPQECLVEIPFTRAAKWRYLKSTDFISGSDPEIVKRYKSSNVNHPYFEFIKRNSHGDWETHVPDCIVGFTDPNDNSYETFYGPFFSSTRTVYKKSDNNITKALRRQTCEHNPPGVNLAELQREYLQTRRVRRFIQALNKHMCDKIDLEPLDFNEGLIIYASDPSHPKWKLRLQAILEVIDLGLWGHNTWVRKQQIIGKLKRFESAKPGKYPRLIGDIGVVGSLVCGYAAKRAKEWLSTFNYSSKHVGRFVASPHQEVLKETFSELVNPTMSSFFSCFSDDSCLSLKCADGIFKCNLDIKNCDASHTGYMFNAMLDTIPEGEMRKAFQIACNQLQLPFIIRSNDGKRKLSLCLDQQDTGGYSHFLASGSILTTYINSLASLLMYLSVTSIDFSGVRIADASEIVQRQCLRSGYQVTCEVAVKMQQLQFLKHSPNSNCEPWLNLGVMLRVVGKCFGPLPGPGTFKSRCETNDSNLVAGMIHAGDSCLYRCMAEKHKPGNFIKSESNSLNYNYQLFKTAARVTDEDLVSRYTRWESKPTELREFTTSDFTHICHLYRNSEVGDCLRTPLSDRIFEVDYGYPPATVHTIPVPSSTHKWNYNGFSSESKRTKRLALIYGQYFTVYMESGG